MYTFEFTSKFKKDFKSAEKQQKNTDILDEVLTKLSNGEKLDETYKAHKLKGNYLGYWECHLQPDWLLIWKKDELNKVISLARLGSHSELFK